MQYLQNLTIFSRRLSTLGYTARYEYSHAILAQRFIAVVLQRCELLETHELSPLANSTRQAAADQVFLNTANNLSQGLYSVISSYQTSSDPVLKDIFLIWVMPE